MSAIASILGVGAVTPVGLSGPATFAALYAGIARLGALGSYDVAGEGVNSAPLVGGRVPLELLSSLPEGELSDYPGHRAYDLEQPPPLATLVDDGPDRLATMLRLAIEEAAAAADWTSGEPVSVCLALDPADDDEASRAALRAACIAGLADRGLALAQLEHVARGRPSALLACAEAHKLLALRPGARVIVAGVGSLIRPRDAARLDAFGNLRSADKPLGIFPGECAAALALGSAGRGELALHPVAVEQEAAVPGAPTDARALSDALRAALERAGGAAPRPLVVCDLNGDRYRGLEWGLALARALGAVHEDGDVWHPAEAIGDAGAGLGALVLAWAAHALKAGETEASRALCWAASDDGARAACTISRPG